jgi:DNA-binding IclR family transcriptional regulator
MNHTQPMTKQPVRKIETPALEAAGLDGTQAIRRAVTILKIIASGRDPGVTLAHVSKTIQLSRSTTHRILKCLVAERLIEQEPQEHRYTIGRLAYELGLSVVRDFHVTTEWTHFVDTVARLTNHTAYLLARSGTDAVCIQKADGRGLLRVVPVDVGQRRPLGVGAGAIALLSTFGPAEIERIVQSITPSLHQFPNLTPERVISDALEAKKRGFSISRGRVFNEVVGLGFMLPTTAESHLAVSIAAPASAVSEERLEQLAKAIRAAITDNARGSARRTSQ